MRNQIWDSTFADLHFLDLAEFVFSLGGFDAVDGEATFGIVDQAKVLAGLVNRDHVHVARRVGGIGSHLAINLDEALHENSHCLAAIEGVLETIAKEHDQGEAVSSFLLRMLSVLRSEVKLRFSLHAGLAMPSAHRHRKACREASAKAH
jgi:hypothetical protein